MATEGRNFLFMKRTWLGAAVAAGVLLGVNIPEFWKGIGGSGSNPLMQGETNSTITEVDKTASTSKIETAESDDSAAANAKSAAAESIWTKFFPSGRKPDVVEVEIVDRSLALRSDGGSRPIELSEVVELVKNVKGNADGDRLWIHLNRNSRIGTRDVLRDAVINSGIPAEGIDEIRQTNGE